MRTKLAMLACAGACGLWVFSAGCIKRTERITIFDDGRVKVNLDYEGKPEHMRGPDAMPSAKSGWAVTETTRKDNGDDEERLVLLAERTFEPGADLPQSYAAWDDPNAAIYTRFPTTLTIEHRDDGVYLHFRRVYTARPWAYVEYWENAIIDDGVKKLAEKPAEELTSEERSKLLVAFATVEAARHFEHARVALRDCDPGLAQDYWLKAREAIEKSYKSVDFNRIAEEYASLPKEEQEQRFAAESEQVHRNAHLALERSLKKDAGYDTARLDKFNRAFDRAKQAYEITGALGSHGFDIGVKMPGEVVAHNADKDEDGWLTWEFSGESFRDRDQELMVTSRLSQSKPRANKD